MTFTYNGYKFESRQSEAQNIVWLEGKPDDSEAMPRSFDREAVAEHFLINRDMPEYKATFKQQIIIERIEGELAVVVLNPGYNIIERILYKPELAKTILDAIKAASELW